MTTIPPVRRISVIDDTFLHGTREIARNAVVSVEPYEASPATTIIVLNNGERLATVTPIAAVRRMIGWPR